MNNNTVTIDEKTIYKAVYEEIRDVSDWCHDEDTTCREVANYIDGMVTVTERLLKEIKDINEKTERNNG